MSCTSCVKLFKRSLLLSLGTFLLLKLQEFLRQHVQHLGSGPGVVLQTLVYPLFCLLCPASRFVMVSGIQSQKQLPTLTTSSPDRDRHLLVHQVNICLGTSFSLG